MRAVQTRTQQGVHRVVHAVDMGTTGRPTHVQVFVTTLVLDLLYSELFYVMTFCTLNSFMLCTHQWMCSSSDTPAFPFFYKFRGCVCTDFRVYSGVGVVGVQLTKYSLDVMREYGRRRHGEPCN